MSTKRRPRAGSQASSGLGQEPELDEAVRMMLLLMPRVVGRTKRLRMPEQLEGFNLAPRHLSLLAYLLFDGPLAVNELAARLEVAPTTVSLMVGDLSRKGVVERREDDNDRRRTIVSIAEENSEAVNAWLAGSATAWRKAFGPLSAAERATVVRALTAYEEAMASGEA